MDWTRAIGIHLVTIVHCINDTNVAFDYSNQDTRFEKWREAFYRIQIQFGMPIFFYISGMSAVFFNFERGYSFLRFFKGKLQRLMFPFVLGIIFIILPRLYLIQSWNEWAKVGDKEEYNVFKFCVGSLTDNFLGKLGPMWFLLFLWIMMMINYPLIKWTSRR